MPIESFRDRKAEQLFDDKWVSDYQSFSDQAIRRLNMLDRAKSLSDMTEFPGNRLEVLRGDRSGQYSIRINRQWRICFRWIDGDAHDVEIVDYH